MFLADKSSPWYKAFPNFDKKFNIEDFQKDVDDIIAMSESLTMQRAESQSNSELEKWNLLGLSGFKVPNETMTVANILQSPIPIDKKTVTADFASDKNATRIYAYARNVDGNADRCENHKEDLKTWLKSMPPEPKNPKPPRRSKEDKETETETKKKSVGFPKGAAAEHFASRKPVRMQVLDRVIEKSLSVKRPPPGAYAVASVLKNDQEIMDSLDSIPVFNNVFDSENVGKLCSQLIFLYFIYTHTVLCFVNCIDQKHLTRLATIAFGYNDAQSANEVLRLVFADELKQQRKKAEEEAKMTPEARAARDAVTAARLLKQKERYQATKLKKKQEKDAAAAAALNGNLEAIQEEQQSASETDESVNELESSDESDTSSQRPNGSDEEEEEEDEDEAIFNAHRKNYSKQKTSKVEQLRQLKVAADKIKKTMVNKIAKVNKVVAQPSQVTAVSSTIVHSSNLALLQEAYPKMLANVLLKENIKIDDLPDSIVGALVCLKVRLFILCYNFIFAIIICYA